MNIEVLKTYLRFEPDFSLNKIKGQTIIDVDLLDSTDIISLHAKKIDIYSLNVFENKSSILKEYSILEEDQKLEMHFTKEVIGKITIEISFFSKINDQFVGFYKSNQNKNGDFLLVTQFYETEARKAFPCFDTPNFKSVFDVEVVIDKDLTAVFNTDILTEESGQNNKKIVHFEQTPKMPTALLFLGIGKLDILEKTGDGQKFRFIAEKPKAQEYGLFALNFLVNAFSYSQEYFKLPYPITKLDLFSLNNFYGGAMENWGIISIRENLSLFYKDLSSSATQYRIRITIAHETAHQWFGDLVSPTDYKKYIWLNESFATYFSYKTVNNFYPEKMIWEKFLKDQMVPAFHRDSFYHTVPIELSGEASQAIDVLSVPIIYYKGGSILRQLEEYVGSENFRNGIRFYLTSYAYGNATSQDLWESLEETSQLPVTEFMESWVNQPGHPIVSIVRSDEALLLKQERFTFSRQSSTQSWYIPINVTLYFKNGIKKQHILFKSPTFQFLYDHSSDNELLFYFINNSASGFYRVLYDKYNLELILKSYELLDANQKFILVNNYFDFFLAGKITLQSYLDIIVTFKGEINYLLVTTIFNHLKFLKLHLHETLFSKIVDSGKQYLESIAGIIGLEPKATDMDEIIEIRTEIISLLYIFGNKEIKEFGIANYKKIMNNENLDSSLLGGSLFIGSKELADLNSLENKYLTEQREEMKIKFLASIADLPSAFFEDIIRMYRNKKLSDRHFQQFFISLSLNNDFNSKLFDFIRTNYDLFVNQNFYVLQIVLYGVLINSKANIEHLHSFIAEKRIVYKNQDKFFDLVEEEISIYHSVYNLTALDELALIKN